MDQDKLFNLIMKSRKQDIASFMTGYFQNMDDEDINMVLDGIK